MNLKSTKIEKYKVYFRNREEFKRIYKEIFVNEEYKFESRLKKPFIIDCGSHIGLSIIYFKIYYPDSKILGFEPNPENFEILKKNIETNKLRNVELVRAAVSDKEGKVPLRVSFEEKEPWTWGDTIIDNMWGDEDENKKISVETVRLSKYITSKVDLLKMDIEGSEQKVIEEIQNKLSLIKKIILEFHSTPTSRKENNYAIVEKILENSSFEIKIFSKDLKFLFPEFVKRLRRTSFIFTVEATKSK